MTASQTSARARPTGSGGLGINEEAREAVVGAFDALSEWRGELAESAERNGGAVFDKMAAAAKAMGWPAEFVDAARSQIETASKMQLQILDQVMDVWEQQVKSPGSAIAMPSAMLEKFQALPGIPVGAKLPGMPDFGPMAMNPMQFWMQTADMWQKSWAAAMSSWADAQDGRRDGGNSGARSRTAR
jgi:hypothetical protein